MRSGTSEKIPLNLFGESSKTLSFFRRIFQFCHIILKHSILCVGPDGFSHNRVAWKIHPTHGGTTWLWCPSYKKWGIRLGFSTLKETHWLQTDPQKILKKEAPGILAHLLRMVSWNLNTFLRRWLHTPCSLSDVRWARIPREETFSALFFPTAFLGSSITMPLQNRLRWRPCWRVGWVSEAGGKTSQVEGGSTGKAGLSVFILRNFHRQSRKPIGKIIGISTP